MSTPTKLTRFFVTLIAATMPLALLAASQHYKPRLAPTCSPSSSSVTSTTFSGLCTEGVAAGLANEDITITVTATGSAGTFCHNKGNPELVVPGQNPATGTFSSGVTLPASQIKNGSATFPQISFSFSLSTPTTDAAGCPNDNWSVSLGTASWTGSYVVQQPLGTVVNSLSFNF